MSRLMKDSGVSWIGEIPEGWSLLRTKSLWRTVKRIVGSESANYDRLALTMSGVVKRSKEDNEGLQPEQFDGYQILHENELVFKLIDLQNIKTSRVGLSPYTGIVSPAYIILHNGEKDNRYSYYWFDFLYKHQIFNQLADDGVRSALNAKDLENIPMCVPPHQEQKIIADFLDTKCAEIDELISLQDKLIDELKSYKQAIITETVMGGVNPNAGMKDSGVDWIGKIPSGWNVKPLKYVFTHRREKNDPIKSTERLSLSIGTGITLYSEKTTNLDRYKDDFTQYQLAYPDDIVLNCMNMIVGAVGRSNYFGCVSPVYYVIYPTKDDNPRYYGYLLNTPIIRNVYHAFGQGIYAIERGEGKVNTCRLKVPYEDFGRIEIPVPPIKEQKGIADYLDEKCAEIDQLIAIKQQKIEELKEYKKSLIYEYVTGKKQVE